MGANDGLVERPGSTKRRGCPPPFLLWRKDAVESHLSVFVDESGDFGKYEKHEPFYIFTLVLHDQSISIQNDIQALETFLSDIGFKKDHCFHAGPIIRREEEYQYLDIQTRRKMINHLFSFSKKAGISYYAFISEKRKCQDSIQLTMDLSRKLSMFIMKNLEELLKHEKVVVYYDNGQVELSRVLASVFSALLPSVEFRKVQPSGYRLFQVADLLCTLSLVATKYENHCISKSEEAFFGTRREFKKNFGKHLEAMQFK